jgi:RimJ/RimL family protein N-acetyltransferase
MDVTLRPATAADAEITFRWANDPETRAASFRSAAIERGEHERWLLRSLAGTERVLFIAERQGLPVGVLRLDRSLAGQAEIGITVAPEQRGQGLALQVLLAGIERARELGIERLVARIRPDNERSVRSFARAGFCRAEREAVHGQPALRYELRVARDR